MKYKVVYEHKWLIVLIFFFLICLSNFLLVKLPFLSISFPKKDLEHSLLDFLLSFCPHFNVEMQTYNIQTVVVWSCGVLLGPRLGFLTLMVYLLAGFIGLPVFAGGGGFDYYKEPTFGYLVSLPFNAYLSGWFYRNNRKFLAVFIPIIITHFFGIIYLLFFKNSWLDVTWYLSFSMIGYDLLFSFFLTLCMPFISFLVVEMFIQEKSIYDSVQTPNAGGRGLRFTDHNI